MKANQSNTIATSKKVKEKKIGIWKLVAVVYGGGLILLSPFLVANWMLFLSSKTICRILISGGISEPEAAIILLNKGAWRGGGPGALTGNCFRLLNNQRSSVRSK